MAAGYKRLGNCRDVIFRRPGHACFACGDSGVIQNGDGLVNRLVFADYDLLAGPRRHHHGRRITATRQHCQNLARAQVSTQPAVTGFHSIGTSLATSLGGLSLEDLEAGLAEPLPASAQLEPPAQLQLPAAADPAGS